MTDFLSLPGAVEAAGADAGVAAHYGNPMREQRDLAAGRAVVDLSHRGVLTITGPDRLTWLDSITSQSIAGLAPGQSAETLVLDPNGRVEHALRLVDDAETLWVLVEAAELPLLAAWLNRMKFMLRVQIDDRTADFATIGTFADLADPESAAGSLPIAESGGIRLVWRDPWTATTPGGHQYAGPAHPGAGFTYSEALVPRGSLNASAIPVAGTLALEALRIAAWRPRLAAEVDEKTIPHELDWLRSAVHLNKGCYRGQETVAKVHNLGHPPRRLVLLHLDGSDAVLPNPGDPVFAEDKEVGRVTSAAQHYELGPIALAVVRRNTDPTATLTVHSDGVPVAAAQEVIVPPDAGATANVPRLPRLGQVRRPTS